MDEIGKDLDRTSFAGTGWREAPLFEAGLVVMSPAAGRAFEEAGVPDMDKPYAASGVRPFVERHRRADWPAISDGEREANLSAVEGGERIVGAYELPGTGRLFLIVTDREVLAGGWRRRPGTTILLPEEFDR